MLVTCEICGKEYDDVFHFTFCPHLFFEPSADAIKALKVREEGKIPPPPSGIEGMVCADIARRQQHGISKYGQTVADNPLSLKEWLNHAYEEALDSCVYLRRAIDEIDRTREYEQQG